MALLNSYAIWNNKGGVGKSTITFHLAMRYAELHPEKNVLVIDLCPQSNSSMMLLGGGENGEKEVLELCSAGTPKSVVGYLSTVITNGRGSSLPDLHEYIIKPHTINNAVPENIFLLSGDGNLEPMAPAINEAASQKALTPSAQPWKWILELFKDLINHTINTYPQKDWMVFIDTNPSFSIYTQMAVSSASRLIVPVNADDSSKTAASAMITLLHGSNPPHPIYGSWTYAAMSQQNNVIIPKIHLLIGNRLTQFEGPAAAFGALSDATSAELYDIYRSHADYFTKRTVQIKDKTSFTANYSKPLRDFNTVGVVCAHLGKKMSSMKQGYYPVYGANVKVNKEKINECLDAIDNIVNSL